MKDSIREGLMRRFFTEVHQHDICLLWNTDDPNGPYRSISVDGLPRHTHRVFYEIFIGPIPEGLHIDHLCRNRPCVNPVHLEPVTSRENVLRSPITRASINAARTHCPRGHEYSESNVYWDRSRNPARPSRKCKACQHMRARARRAARREAREAAAR
jgi:hypothetical protein